jgi:[ribosomal protein S5]-alanine N-acetyltransferase
LETGNLRLIAHTPEHLRALLRSAGDYAREVGYGIEPEVADLFSQASPEFVSRLWSAVSPDPWRDGFGMLHKLNEVVVGLCGYAGPPSAEGVVEIAYGVATSYQGKGLATEAVVALVQNAFAHPEVTAVIAHTLPTSNASTRVLEKCGFARAGEATDLEAGRVWRWELKRSNRA